MKYLALALALCSLEASANICQNDIKRFCSSTKPGDGQVSKCLLENLSLLSSACSKELKKSIQTTDDKNPCQNDLVDLCSDMPLQGEKLSYCLLKNETKLSGKCAADFKPLKAKFLSSNPCAAEVVEHCYSEIKGPNSVISRCLIKNKSKASKTCQANLDKLVDNLKKNNACYDEVEKHCPQQVKPSEIHQCLQQKLTQLPPKCKAQVEKQAQKIKSHPCYSDLSGICKTALTPANKQKCLTTYESKLTPACRSHQQAQSQKLNQLVTACEADRLKHCAHIPKSAGKIIRCLNLNKSKISAQCKNSL